MVCTAARKKSDGTYETCLLSWNHDSDHLYSSDKPKKVAFVGGLATSTKVPNLGRIPLKALEALADRISLGVERHKEKAWNAQSPNFEKVNDDLSFTLERLVHNIVHSYHAIEKLTGKRPWDGEDDSGAVLFAGSVLACSTNWQKLKENRPPERIRTCVEETSD